MRIRKSHRCFLVIAAMVLTAHASAAAAREPLVLPAVTDAFPAPFEIVWEATLRSLAAAPPTLADKAQGRIESDPFFFRFRSGTRVSQAVLVSLVITLSRADAQHTTVQVQPRVYFMLYDGVLPGPMNNPWADLIASIRDNLGQPA